MAAPRVETMPAALGGRRSVVPGVFFGRLWSAVLSPAMATIERLVRPPDARQEGTFDRAASHGKQAAPARGVNIQQRERRR
ncbi:MAG: hypothetical protein M3361_04130, partial [Candidatus Tectomicrobia bacterium]|nr:hypothetical protein [Candidatus Tectomicrobia bacterium]